MERKGTGKLRVENDKRIKDYFLINKQATKKEIAKKLNISVMTVGTILHDFLEKEIIIEKAYDKPQYGRPTCIYEINPDYFHLLTCRLLKRHQNNFVFYEVVDALDNIVYQETIQCKDFFVNEFLDKIKTIVFNDALIQEVGIGVPGIIQNGYILDCDISEFKDCDLKQSLFSIVHLPITIYNDMKCCAYGYYKQLDNKQDLCFVTFPKNSGPGCGYVVNEKLYTGQHDIAGEMMYLPMFGKLKSKNFDYDINNVVECLSTIICMMNPIQVLITGDFIQESDMDKLNIKLKDYIPESFMPDIQYIHSYDDYYLVGLKQLMIENIK